MAIKIFSEINFHEMKRRWAIGEICSVFFKPDDQSERKEVLSLLEAEDQVKQKEGIDRYLQKSNRRGLIYSFPQSTEWFLASLPVVKDEFERLKTMNYRKWKEFSSGSYLLVNAARYLTDNFGVDERIGSIIIGLPYGKIELRGITLISQKDDGSYFIAEGHARLVAIYHHCIDKRIKLFENDEIEVVLGVSKDKWYLSPV